MLPDCALPPLVEFKIFPSNSDPFTIAINENKKLSDLKALLSNKLKINKNLICLQSSADKKEINEEKYDYPILTLWQMTGSKLIYQEKKLQIDYLETPRYILANSDNFNRLLEFLPISNEDIVYEIWNLILSLPINESYKEKLIKLELIENWERYLGITENVNSILLTYFFRVLLSLIQEENIGDYKNEFLSKGGVAFVISVFSKKSKDPKEFFNQTCLKYSMRIILEYLSPENYATFFQKIKQQNNEDVEGKMWDSAISVIDWINSVKQERKSDLFKHSFQIQYIMALSNTKFLESLSTEKYFNIIFTSICYLTNINSPFK